MTPSGNPEGSLTLGELKIPLERLNFLLAVSPTSLSPLINSLRQRHSAAAPESVKAHAAHNAPSEDDARHLRLTNEVADLTGGDLVLTRGLAVEISGMKDMKEIARTFSHKKMAEVVRVDSKSKNGDERRNIATSAGDVGSENAMSLPSSVVELQRKLFHRHASSVVARMIEDQEIHLGPLSSTTSVKSTQTLALASKTESPKGDEDSLPRKVVTYLDANPNFDIRSKSVAVQISENGQSLQAPVVKALQQLQTMQALAHTPEALPALSTTGMTSAIVVAQIPEKTFVSRMGKLVGADDVARAIHGHAANITTRNSIALTSILQSARGTGLAMIDGNKTRSHMISESMVAAEGELEQVNLEALFGAMDICECDDCNSVTSPAAYFVELLQYLRNNNLDPASPFMNSSTKKGMPGIQDGTPLRVLLARRPDIANLQLTCANATTVLPYIDLANEVMESFILHLDQYAASSSSPKQAAIDVFDADPNATEGLGGSTPELLAQPQNSRDEAYCILSNAVYPSTQLPFNQPVAAIRLFFEFLQTSRADLGEKFRGKYEPPKLTVPDVISRQNQTPTSSTCQLKHPPKEELPKDCNGCGREKDGTRSCCLPCCHSPSSSPSSSSSSCSDSGNDDTCSQMTPGSASTGTPIPETEQLCLIKLHEVALDRANDAERLLLTEEEYIILTKEAFWAKKHFEIRHGHDITEVTYREKIGVRNDWEYWGVDYTSIDDMLTQDESLHTGLTFVKDQFLPRTGVTYGDLVELLRTDFINENLPKGRNAVIMETFRMCYKFMKKLVLPIKGKERFWPLVCALDSPQWRIYLKNAQAPDVMHLFDKDENGCEDTRKCRNHHSLSCTCKRRKRILKWLCHNFDRMGHIIVLESLLDPLRLPWQAKLVVRKPFVPHPRPHLTASAASDEPENNGVSTDEMVVGRLLQNGNIIAWNGTNEFNSTGVVIGRLDPLMETVVAIRGGENGLSETPWSSQYPVESLEPRETRVLSLSGTDIGKIDSDSKMHITAEEDQAVPWVGLNDDCDISKDRLRHLDGSSLTPEEYDRIHRFIRLWRKLGWTMVELDAALRVLGVPRPEVPICSPPTYPNDPTTPGDSTEDVDEDVDWIDFFRSCSDGKCGQRGCRSCKDSTKPPSADCKPREARCGCHTDHCPHKTPTKIHPPSRPVISTAFLRELVSLKKLADLTGQDTVALCAFWGTITTAGSVSLYSRLFLTHNLLGIDRVFAADENRNYLATSPPSKIRDHVPILLAAFQLKINDFNNMINETSILDGGFGTDLSLEIVSKLYRYVLIARIFSVSPSLVAHILDTLNLTEAFSSAVFTLELVEL